LHMEYSHLKAMCHLSQPYDNDEVVIRADGYIRINDGAHVSILFVETPFNYPMDWLLYKKRVMEFIRVNPGEPIELTIEEANSDYRQVTLEQAGNTMSYEFENGLLVRDTFKVPNLPHLCVMEYVTPEYFVRRLNSAGVDNDYIGIKRINGEIQMLTFDESEFVSATMKMRVIERDKYPFDHVYYSIPYLKSAGICLKRVHSTLKCNGIVRFEFGDEYPCSLSMDTPIGEIFIYIAPRIVEEA